MLFKLLFLFKRIAVLLGALVTVVLFQNCSGSMYAYRYSNLGSKSLSSYSAPSIQAQANNPSETNLRSLNLNFDFKMDQSLQVASATCRVDNVPAVSCINGSFAVNGLADGDHTITVTLTDSAGQMAQDLTVLLRVDATAPKLTISQKPPTVSGNAASLVFSANDALSSMTAIECALDNAAFAACTSPVNLTALVDGAHTFKIRAKDKLGNTSAEDVSSWTVDSSAPAVTISAKPASVTNLRAATFAFSATLNGAAVTAFQCSLDNAAFTSCTSPMNVNVTADGDHNFRIAARNNNNLYLNPSAYSWKVDTVTPSVPAITSNVMVNTNLLNAQFTFVSTDAATGIQKYQCSLDNAAFADCVSPLNFTNLAQGTHALNVRALDLAGNTSANSTFNWRVDTTPPVLTITAAPQPTTTETTASFVFTATDADSGVLATECQLDTSTYATCTSPYMVSNLSSASHNVQIRVRDRAGNQVSATHSWMVYSQPPNGALLYASKCAGCHGPLETSAKLGRTAAQIQNAMMTVPSMQALAATTPADQVLAIADALKISAGQPRFQCTDPSIRGLAETRLPRLSSEEYTNTLNDIFGQDVVATVSAVSSYPSDLARDSMLTFNPAHARDHVEAIFNVSLELAQKVVANNTYLNRVAPVCVSQGLAANAIVDTCITQFAREFGLKIHRRTLTTAQEQAYLAFYKDPTIAALTIKERLETLMARIIQAPEAQYHWAQATLGAAGTRARVDAFTVASRLSYRLLGTTPDATLLAAAAAGNLTTLAQVQAQAERLIVTPRARQRVRSMIYHWMRLHKVPVPTAIATGAAGLDNSDNARLNLKNEMITESLDFAEYVIFDANGTAADLMTSDWAFPRSSEAAKLFGTAVATGAPVRATNGRKGLIMRPSILFSGTDRDAPIKRGVSMRVRMLCDDVPPPPADIDTEIANISNSFDHSAFSSREGAEKMTGTGTCVTCHSRLNSLGFALSSFGPLGELRTVDRSFNSDGTVKSQFPINSSATNLDIISPNDSTDGHNGLSSLMAQAQKPKSCFALYAFRATRNRMELAEDKCQLADIEAAVTGNNTTIKQGLIKNVASEDIFWKGF